MSVPTRGRGGKDLWSLSSQFLKFFCCKVLVPMSKKMDKRSYAICFAYPDVSVSLKFARGSLRFVTSHSRQMCSPLCETMPETTSLRRGLLMYYLAGRYRSMLNFAVSIFFFVYRSLCPLPLMDSFRVSWLQLNNKNQNFIRGWTTHYEVLQKHKQNYYLAFFFWNIKLNLSDVPHLLTKKNRFQQLIILFFLHLDTARVSNVPSW